MFQPCIRYDLTELDMDYLKQQNEAKKVPYPIAWVAGSGELSPASRLRLILISSGPLAMSPPESRIPNPESSDQWITAICSVFCPRVYPGGGEKGGESKRHQQEGGNGVSKDKYPSRSKLSSQYRRLPAPCWSEGMRRESWKMSRRGLRD
ncbi:hypothetical protein EMPG_14416 [Blastomyces silverae]|uniref:Uncharacterized protein n=1 Tax=Blastomyces silverae TaxID=2060906 RepID=A0A0H1BFC6_9EURO|nr:hypothetical protein EMPG_14416 [Blastomyces silverae]